MADREIEFAFARPGRQRPCATHQVAGLGRDLSSAVRANDMSLESRSIRQWDGFGERTRSWFDLATKVNNPRGQRLEERDVWRVCEIDPKTHRGSELKFD